MVNSAYIFVMLKNFLINFLRTIIKCYKLGVSSLFMVRDVDSYLHVLITQKRQSRFMDLFEVLY